MSFLLQQITGKFQPYKSKKNRVILLYFSRLIVSLAQSTEDRLHLGNTKENRNFLLYFSRFALSLHPETKTQEK